jgi:ABC-type antimicrobial peptide transport system permease subunit
LRIALGARASQVLSRVLREAFWVTGAGIVLGLIAALWLTRFIRVMLYGLAGTDALTVGGTAALLIAVSLLAAFAPARRASRIDPIRALGMIEMRLGKLEFPRIRSDSTDLQWLF